MTRRSPNLTPERVDAILEIIRGWDGRLTWPALIEAVAAKFRATYTRQALYKQERIRVAYETYRENTSESGGDNAASRPVSAAHQASMDRIARLEQENAELKKREALLLEQFVRWAYNASTRGLTEDFLNQSLPAANRRGNTVSRHQP